MSPTPLKLLLSLFPPRVATLLFSFFFLLRQVEKELQRGWGEKGKKINVEFEVFFCHVSVPRVGNSVIILLYDL